MANRAGSRPRVWRRPLGIVLALVVGSLATTPAQATGDGHEGADLRSMPAPIVVEATHPAIDVGDPALVADLVDDHNDFDDGPTRSVAEPVRSWPLALAAGSGFSVTFDATHTAPTNVQSVILSAAADWDAALWSSVAGPVEIAVIWQDLGSPGLLGSAGPNGLFTSGSLPTTSWYPAPLANTLLGRDINDEVYGQPTPELTINLNSTPNWYIGTGGTPSGSQIDLYSVVLHEIGHGLGFLGSGSVGNDPGPDPTLDDPAFVFDRAVTYDGAPLLSMADPDGLLRSNNLYIDVSDGLSAKLYAPGNWQEGSSFSHFDEAANPPGSPGALMTPSLGSHQTERVLDTSILGVMAGMGWPVRVLAVTPTVTATSATGGQISVSWDGNHGQVGLPPDGYRVEAWRDGATLDASVTISAQATSAAVTGLCAGSSYTMRVVPYADGADGIPATTMVGATAAPCSPAPVRATGGGLTQTISWSPPAGGGITGYRVERSSDGVTWHDVGTTSGLSLAAAVPAGIHQFRVRAETGSGPGSYGYTIPTAVSAGLTRPVALDGQIDRLYRAYFLRGPDGPGFEHWQGARAGGLTLGAVSDAFASSAEFQSRYGALSDGAFVELVYQNVLGRPADGSGLGYWLGQLGAGVSRGAVMTGFSESSEFVAATATVVPAATAADEVYRLYVASFIRFPDSAGYQYWVGVRQGGTSLETIAAAFVGSAEFVTTYGSLSDDRFVELVYRNVLGRDPEPSGSSYWVSQLQAGVDRGAMMVGFAQSAEFVIATGTLP